MKLHTDLWYSVEISGIDNNSRYFSNSDTDILVCMAQKYPDPYDLSLGPDEYFIGIL